MSTITKAMRYEIVKPTNSTWDDFGKLLNDLRFKCARIANKLVQMMWEWNNYKIKHKKAHGEYPDKKEEPNYYLQLISEFPDVGTMVISQTIQYVKTKFMKDLKDIMALRKGIPYYKSDMPICVHNQAYKILTTDSGDYEISVRLLPKSAEQLWFNFIIKKGNRGQQAILENILNGSYKKGMLQIVRDRHKKWYAVFSFTFEPSPKAGINQDKTLEVNLGDGKLEYKAGGYTGNIPVTHLFESIQRFDRRLESLRAQKNYRGEGRRGHGVKTIFLPMENGQTKKANFKATANHNLSRDIVNTAIRFGCGCIIMTGEFPDWTNNDLYSKAQYKAAEAGVQLSKA